MADTIRVGVVGAGANTRLHHIPKLKKIDGVEIACVANRSRESSEKAAKEFGIPRVHAHWQELVNDPGIDAVVIGTWPYMHCPITLAALEAGKHVLTEARIAMNANEARDMLAASRERPELVTQVVPGPPTFAADPMVMQLLNDGYIGELQALDLHVPTGFLNRDAPLHWRMNREYSGLNIMSMGIWYESVSRWVGHATAVMARTRTAVPYRFDQERGERRAVTIPDHVEVLADLANGAIARMHWSSVAGFMPGPEVWLYGSEGTLRLEQRGRDNLVLSGGKRGDKEMAQIAIPADKTYKWRVEEEFIGAIRGQEQVRRTSFADAVAYMDFTEAVHISSSEGRRVHLPLE
ncbi:MAG TPA: Gfo/Idh/MocA family oxidoreductase [Burkholderiales bacterium]|nr:Gfo/Idh/MocA family oxidoreductase [Burkholderiales bacterium]